ncbi:hypothetical protein N9P31_00915 [bacterium]|nr:hypothetical protein [bacterium]
MVSKFFVAELAIINELLLRQRLSFILFISNGTKIFMYHKSKVLKSINLPGDNICVDIFIRPNNTYGFDEFRRDPEDGRGWFSIGHHGSVEFSSVPEAVAEAMKAIPWLENTFPESSSSKKNLTKNFNAMPDIKGDLFGQS